MKRSELLLRAARRFPGPARALHRLWALSLQLLPRRPHWFFDVLRIELDQRYVAPRKARLVTGQPILVDPFDQFIGAAILRRGCDEPETVELIQRILQPGGVVLDIGANIGQYTLIAAGSVGPTGQVHAFEPEPRTFRLLQRNVALNRLPNVRCNQAAVTDRGGEIELFLSATSNTGGNSVGRTQGVTGRSVTVNALRLDQYLLDAGLLHVHLVKIDVEGAELSVIRGGADCLTRMRPLVVVETSVLSSTFGYDGGGLRNELEGFNYRTFRVGSLPLPPYHPSPSDPDTFNLLGIPAERVQEFQPWLISA